MRDNNESLMELVGVDIESSYGDLKLARGIFNIAEIARVSLSDTQHSWGSLGEFMYETRSRY